MLHVIANKCDRSLLLTCSVARVFSRNSLLKFKQRTEVSIWYVAFVPVSWWEEVHRKYKGTNQQLQLRIIHSYITCVGGLDGRMLTFDGRINILVEAPYIQTVIKQQLMLHWKEGVSQPFQQGLRCSIPTHMQKIRRSQMVLNVAASFKALLGTFTPRMRGREKNCWVKKGRKCNR